jgi:hypothetical protein
MATIKRFPLHHRGQSLVLEIGFGANTDRQADEGSRRDIERLLWSGLTGRDPEVRRTLDAVYHELRGSRASAGSAAAHGPDIEHSLASALRFAVHSGSLRVERVDLPRGQAAAPSPVDSPARPALGPEPKPDAWIAIEVVDDDDKPVPKVAYRIECDDGRVRTGTTDRNGKAREEGIAPGSCEVSFPALHETDWRQTG